MELLCLQLTGKGGEEGGDKDSGPREVFGKALRLMAMFRESQLPGEFGFGDLDVDLKW